MLRQLLREDRRSQSSGFTILEALVAVLLIVLVVAFTGRVIVTSLALIGRGYSDDQQGARLRSQASAWVQAVTEYARKIGFAGLNVVPACQPGPAVPCDFWIPADVSSATAPFDQGPPLPRGFECGRVHLSAWGTLPTPASTPTPATTPNSASLRLVTIEIYRVRSSCSEAGDGTPFLVTHSGIAAR